jgi:hypothetical protein
MGQVGKYCKAYLIERFREYGGWPEEMGELKRGHLYLHENYVVTEGIFMDEDVVFDDVTPEWKDFCEETLGFEVPDFGSAGDRS